MAEFGFSGGHLPFGERLEYEPTPEAKSVFAAYLEGRLEIGAAEQMSKWDLLRTTFGEGASIPEDADLMETGPVLEFLHGVLGTPEDLALELDRMTPEEREEIITDPEVRTILGAYAAMGDMARGGQ